MDVNSFDTHEAILALCLILAGGEPLEESQPCMNLYSEEILGKLGYKGEKLLDAANAAWKNGEKGEVKYLLKMTPRLAELIRAYRDQCEQIEKLDAKATDLIDALISNPVDRDEMILRTACVILKTRGEFMNLWKKMVPLLRVPVDGKSEVHDAAKGAKIVKKPGFKVISLNISDEHRKEMGL